MHISKALRYLFYPKQEREKVNKILEMIETSERFQVHYEDSEIIVLETGEVVSAPVLPKK